MHDSYPRIEEEKAVRKENHVFHRIPYLFYSIWYSVFWGFFLRKISPELTSAANPPLFAEEDWP